MVGSKVKNKNNGFLLVRPFIWIWNAVKTKKRTHLLNIVSFFQVMQTMLNFIPVEHALLQPVLTTLSRCGTSDPIRCYSTTKVKTPEKLYKQNVRFTLKSCENHLQNKNHNFCSTTAYLWLMHRDVAYMFKRLLNHLLHFFSGLFSVKH